MLDESLRSLIALHGVGRPAWGILIVDDEPRTSSSCEFLEAGYRIYEARRRTGAPDCQGGRSRRRDHRPAHAGDERRGAAGQIRNLKPTWPASFDGFTIRRL